MKLSTVVALEIGTSKVAVVVGEPKGDGTIDVLGQGLVDSAGVRKGEIVNFDNALFCVRKALQQAEESSGVTLEELHLVVSGAHVQATLNRAIVPVAIPSDGISVEDIESVRSLARHYQLPIDRKMLHFFDQLYYLDDKDSTYQPEGIEANRLAHDMLLVHVNAMKFRTALRVVRQIGYLDVCDMALGGWCAALAVVSPAQKETGALVIDLGAGTTDFFAYTYGMQAAAGTLGVGGDHIVNDVHLCFNIPLRQAERLVRQQGTVEKPDRADEKIRLAAEDGFSGAEIDSMALYLVIQARLKETLTMIRYKAGSEQGVSFPGIEIYLTGGGARMRGVCDLAQGVFGRPCTVGKPWGYRGQAHVLESPEYAAALGMLRYAVMNPKTRKQGGGWLDGVNRFFTKPLKMLFATSNGDVKE